MIAPFDFRAFFLRLLGIFLFTWIALVVFPWLEIGHQAPIKDETTGDITPWDVSGEAHQGEHVYAAEGCIYCHTQQVRPENSGADITRGWGTAKDESDDKKTVTRRTYPRDYIWQGQVFLGNSRAGADLSNVAQRFPDAASLYRYLYDPSLVNGHSSMPAYRFLFITRHIGGQPSANALTLTGPDAPPPGYEVIPTPEAQSLVAYLLSLKKGYHLPDENGPVATTSPKS
ncbi:MAG: cbb3-type cytochrome c oxidase subunit II [Methylacidiphilales bacterium]|nr:cbb3-type cytochrome c oxidase subunit II [Candidatus Methylacidiphilales bacterium]